MGLELAILGRFLDPETILLIGMWDMIVLAVIVLAVLVLVVLVLAMRVLAVLVLDAIVLAV